MAYDQVLYELGALGAMVFALVLGGHDPRLRRAAARRWRRADPDPLVAYVAPAWTASMLGVLAGIALFGGATVSVLFWLTLGTGGRTRRCRTRGRRRRRYELPTVRPSGRDAADNGNAGAPQHEDEREDDIEEARMDVGDGVHAVERCGAENDEPQQPPTPNP